MDEHPTAAAQQSTHAPRPKAQRKPRVRRDEARIQKKLDAQGRYPIGHPFLYTGPNPLLNARMVKVVGHESRGNIYIQSQTIPGTRAVSPFTLHPITEAR